MADSNGANVGRVEQVTGVVVDAVFPDQLPEIYSALRIEMTVEGTRHFVGATVVPTPFFRPPRKTATPPLP